MIVVDQSRLEAAASFVAQACSDAMNPAMEWCRLIAQQDGLRILGSGSAVTVYRTVPVMEFKTNFDVLVESDRLLAAVKAMSSGGVCLETQQDQSFKLSQGGDDVEATLETKPSSEFMAIPGFDGMTQVFAGQNPAETLSAMKHVAAAHPGNTPLAEVLIMMAGRSYLAGTLSAMRCDGSLVAADNQTVLPVRIAALWPLDKMGPNLQVFHDAGRILVCDELGYVVIGKWAGDLGSFPTTVSDTFASLRKIGDVRVHREAFLRAATAASVILKPLTKEEVFLDCVATKDFLKISASVGRASFRETLDAVSSGNYRIPIHVSRLIAFLKNSGDEFVFVQIMDSKSVPSPRSFVHMTDSRLHEAISIPKPREVQIDA